MDDDTLICFCFNVTRQQIVDVIMRDNPQTVWDLTQHCKAGNGCTSCWADLEALIQQFRQV